MATIANDTQFIGISPTIDLTGKKSAILNAQTEPVTMADITSTVRPYNVFTALLTQSGEDDPLELVDGDAVTKGVTYYIDGTGINADFSNVGGPKFEGTTINGTYFIATTDEIPNNYDEGYLVCNTGAPVATVLENTIGDIWFEYIDVGNYSVNSNGLFTLNKTVNTLSQTANISGLSDTPYYAYCNPQSQNLLEIVILDNTLTTLDDLLISKLIEIRVYE